VNLRRDRDADLVVHLSSDQLSQAIAEYIESRKLIPPGDYVSDSSVRHDASVVIELWRKE
jgi:hypothetical protein